MTQDLRLKQRNDLALKYLNQTGLVRDMDLRRQRMAEAFRAVGESLKLTYNHPQRVAGLDGKIRITYREYDLELLDGAAMVAFCAEYEAAVETMKLLRSEAAAAGALLSPTE